MKKVLFALSFLMIFGEGIVLAQAKVIRGTVTDSENGDPIPGVSVFVKGTTTGTVTQSDGAYSLKMPQDAETIIFSFVGMKSQEVVYSGQATIDISMKSELSQLDEVVVTALGISRDKKSLGYAVQKVGGEEVNSVKSDNFITSLSGRVSGISVKNNTNFGGSTNVIIRGSSSLTNSNQALFVVDGIPIDNSNTNNDGELTGRNGYDYGNAASDINPNDIESISVLKGAAATALYGSRAANGVILISLKKGKSSKSGKPLVKLSSNVTFSKIDKSTFPSYQNEYGAGYGPYYSNKIKESQYPAFSYSADVDGDGKVDYTVPYSEDASRGEKFDPNLMIYQWDAFDPESPNYMKRTPWIAGANGPDSFFETGVSTTENVEISGGTDETTYRFSYTYFDQSGVMPNSFLDKHNVMFSGSHKILDNLKITSSANYISTDGKGRPSTGYNDNIMSSFRQWYQVNVDLDMQKYMYHKTGRNASWNRADYEDSTPLYWDNPYWIRYENYETDNRKRLIGYVQMDWDIARGLSAMGRYAIDTYNELQEERKAVGSIAGEFGVGRRDVSSGYSRYARDFSETNLDFMLNYKKKISGSFDFSALLGANIRRTKTESVFTSTNNGLSVPGIYALKNSLDPMLPPEESLEEIGINGFFGSVSLGFFDTFFVDATLRRDQSSTLPTDNNSYYYPSVTASILFSNLLNAPWLSLGKVRFNFAEVGSSAPALSIKDTYTENASFSGTSLVAVPDIKKNPDLKPERQRAFEAGLEMNLFRNRLGFDLAIYKNNTFDQLMPVSVSYATGYSSKWVNAGEVENRGAELALFGTPLKTKNFSWNIGVNWAKNENEVVDLYVDEAGNKVTNLVIGSLQGGVSVNATIGEAYGTIKGSDFQYHQNGGKLVDSETGHYLITPTNDVVIGNVNPDWTAGINNSFKYKNLSCSFLIDIQNGGDIFSLDMWYGMGTGLYEETAGLNDLGNPKRDPIAGRNDASRSYASNSGGTVNKGVLEDGSENWVRVNNEDSDAEGWNVDPNARYVYDASYVKLREVTLSYDLPKKWINKFALSGASIGFVGSNLWIIHKNLPYADPEASQSSGNIQGWQCGVMPANKNYGFTLNLQF